MSRNLSIDRQPPEIFDIMDTFQTTNKNTLTMDSPTISPVTVTQPSAGVTTMATHDAFEMLQPVSMVSNHTFLYIVHIQRLIKDLWQTIVLANAMGAASTILPPGTIEEDVIVSYSKRIAVRPRGALLFRKLIAAQDCEEVWKSLAGSNTTTLIQRKKEMHEIITKAPAVTSNDDRTFTDFPNLPNEIQLEIWREAVTLTPQIIHPIVLNKDYKVRNIFSTSSPFYL